MKLKLILLTYFLLITHLLTAQERAPEYFIYFSDKEQNEFDIDRPSSFLSARALQKRALHKIPIDSLDLPVSQTYIDLIENTGAKVIYGSKWLNGIRASIASPGILNSITSFSFVDSLVLAHPGKSGLKTFMVPKFNMDFGISYQKDHPYYGASFNQIHQLSAEILHQKGIHGKNVLIAILDGGFAGADTSRVFSKLRSEGRLAGFRDFVNNNIPPYRDHRHGTIVLSIMAGEEHGEIAGIAPDASYYLIRTEDVRSEYRVEEFNWVRGAELADSMGADVINSSLGYSVFDMESMNYTYSEMDGETTIVSKGAKIAFQKGMIVCTSAGNEGAKSWKYITSPGDSPYAITSGAVDTTGRYAGFSSVGPTSDGRIKPDVATTGHNTIVFDPESDKVTAGSGTSYASPLTAGFTALLKEAFSHKTNEEIYEAIKKSSSQYMNPGFKKGYGIPNAVEAFNILNNENLYSPVTEALQPIRVFPTHTNSRIYIQVNEKFKNLTILVYNLHGQKLSEIRIDSTDSNSDGFMSFSGFNTMSEGIYILQVKKDGKKYNFKIIKTP
jgi:hypothetical protein